jgi:hypothetical protein
MMNTPGSGMQKAEAGRTRWPVTALRIIVASLATLVFIAGGSDVPGTAADDDSANIRFDVTFLPPNFWQGAVSGAFSGRTQAAFRLLDRDDAAWRLSSAWSVDAGVHSFVAQLKGTYSTRTGKATMQGKIIDGYQKGRPVHLEADLVSVPQRFRFSGTIRISPEGE